MVHLDDYLQRIGITRNGLSPDKFEALKQLQLHHLLHVPFENLDVIRGIPIILDVRAFYEKVVTNHRGGYCYELNGLFNWLLQQLGYDCYLVAATVLRPDGTFATERSHATQIVVLDQPYVVDVGFGDSTYQPLPLTGEVHEDVSGKYRIRKNNNDTYDLQRKKGVGNWITLQRIEMTQWDLEDFDQACHFNQTSPNSTFTKHDIVTIATLNGRYTLSDKELTITKHGNKKKQVLTEEEKSSVLKGYFRIEEKTIR